MLIVTDTSLRSAFEVLADWKRTKGVPTEVVTVEWIGQNVQGVDSAEKIRNYIRELFLGDNLGYVLLGGDTDVVAHRLVHARALFTYDDVFASDFYFSDLDGSWDANDDGTYGALDDDLEMHPDLAVGRAPVSTMAEAEGTIR